MAKHNIQLQSPNTSQVKKLVEDLTLLDDNLMSNVFDKNIPATELLLKIILERDDIKVISVKGQYHLKNNLHQGRNIILDIHAKDSNGKHYDIEVQRSNDGAHVRRARFCSSMLDTRMLKSSQKFQELKDSYVIFITEHDIFKKGLPIYHLERIIKETRKDANDGSHIIYVNGSYKGNNPIGRLMHDFRTKKSSEMHFKELGTAIKYFKEDEKGVKQMCDSIRKYGDERAAKATAKAEKKRLMTIHSMVKNLMKSAHYTSEQALNAVDLDKNDRKIIMQMLG